jgi:hypothetical protein
MRCFPSPLRINHGLPTLINPLKTLFHLLAVMEDMPRLVKRQVTCDTAIGSPPHGIFAVQGGVLDRLHLIGRHGRLRVLSDMRDFRGREAGALREDLQFSISHFSDIERVAFVGEKKWQEWKATFCQPFPRAKVAYFDQGEHDMALRWVANE